jgi:hypothetical protein
MKNLKLFIVVVVFFYKPVTSISQTLNWASLRKSQKHIISINAGVEHGIIYKVDYGYRFKSSLPIILNAEYSFASGKNLFDDFKTKVGGQIKIYQTGNFHFSGKFYTVFRRYESEFVRLLNFGSDISATAGYYKPKWFVAGETGFDKAIVTHFKHTGSYKSLFPGVQDGWYEPATGGNFYYGIQTGYSFKQSDVYLKLGKIINQDFQTQPLIPFSVQLGFNWKIGR